MKSAKDTPPAKKEPGVVYAVGCKQCPDVYIVETKRTVATRTREHQYRTNMATQNDQALQSTLTRTGTLSTGNP